MVKKVIGEGSYGCVHKPSLHCLDEPSDINYEDSVSKFMKKDDAETELKDFVIMTFLDKKNQYHLGLPKICTPNYNDETILNDISNCSYFNKDDVVKNPNNFKLLILKYGGPDLKNFCMNHLKAFLETGEGKLKKSKIFWEEVKHLIEGLLFFKKNGIVHYDIKPQNILFNPLTNKMVFIDFGFMILKEDLMKECLTNKNKLGTFHWSYPFDNGFINIDKLTKYKNLTSKNKTKFQKELANLIVFDSNKNTLDISIRKPQAFKLLFSYLDLYEEEPSNKTQIKYINSFFKGFNEFIKNNDTEKVTEHSIDTIDIFCLGFSLQYVLNNFYLEQAVTEDFYTKCSALFGSMYNFNPILRELSVETILHKYNQILDHFLNDTHSTKHHTYPNISPKNKNESSSSLSSSKYYNNLANLDAIDLPIFHSKGRGRSKSKHKRHTLKGKKNTRKNKV